MFKNVHGAKNKESQGCACVTDTIIRLYSFCITVQKTLVTYQEMQRKSVYIYLDSDSLQCFTKSLEKRAL